jgi:hypothetical protein
MERFIQKYRSDVTGSLNGWDRLMIRGTIRMLAAVPPLMSFLSHVGVLLKDFGGYVEGVSQRLKEASLATAARLNRPVRYLPSSQTRKEDLARQIAESDGINEGLVCVLTCVEPCWSYSIRKDRPSKKLVLERALRKCLHLYHYWMDKDFGLMHGRVMTWLPFTIQVCVNGRLWLARQLDRLGLGYQRADNCFVRLADAAACQRAMDGLLRWNWPAFLDRIAAQVNPILPAILRGYRAGYYWSAYETEWASDVMFRSPAALAAIYPLLARGAIVAFASHNVMRFFGQKLHGNFRGQLVSDYGWRVEGIRVKHSLASNSIKMYDKAASVLRVETTINDPRRLKVYRSGEGDSGGRHEWRRMRKGVVDLRRRAEVSQAANERYYDALAALDTTQPLRQLIGPICRPTRWGDRPVRGLRPWADPDLAVLRVINRGEFAVNGFRNRDLRAAIYPQRTSDPDQARRASARVSRLLRVLRAHHLIQKISHTHRYQLTQAGRQIVTAILQAQDVSIAKLTEIAA